MEMMEEYREADQAHKKNVKALLHNGEAIVKGGIGKMCIRDRRYVVIQIKKRKKR